MRSLFDCRVLMSTANTHFDRRETMNANDKASWLAVIWDALEGYREEAIPEGVEPEYDEEWDNICTAMAWVAEELELEIEEVE